jgi:hypothetical protein
MNVDFEKSEAVALCAAESEVTLVTGVIELFPEDMVMLE